MMAINQVMIPKSLPLAFYLMNVDQVPQYLSRHMDDFLLSNQLEVYETPVVYEQKWTTSDVIPLQFQANFGSIQIQLIDCRQTVYQTFLATRVRANKFYPGFYIYEQYISLAGVAPGKYWFKSTLGGTTTMISEPLDIQYDQPGTLLFEYKNSKYHGDVIYETGIELAFRCEAKLYDVAFGAERTLYRDQRLNPTVLQSIPFRTWTLVFGKDYGLPDWVGEKINWIFSCDNVQVDGKAYAVDGDSSLEAQGIDELYKLRRYTLKVQEGINNPSKTLGVEVDPNQRLIMAVSVDDTFFGDIATGQGNNVIPVLTVN